MATLKWIAMFAVAAFVNMSVPVSARAADPQVTEWGTLVALQSGWVVDQMLIFHNAPLKNPDGCSITTNGYLTNTDHPGHTLFHTMLLTAIVSRREVQFVISGCRENRPQIVSVSIR